MAGTQGPRGRMAMWIAIAVVVVIGLILFFTMYRGAGVTASHKATLPAGEAPSNSATTTPG